jgi:DNA replication and repair protein RecF
VLVEASARTGTHPPAGVEDRGDRPVGPVMGGALRVDRLEVQDLRNIERADIQLHPGLNVLFGRNAQGKTSLLEAVGLLARGRSFRTDDTRSLIRRGSASLSTRGGCGEGPSQMCLEVEVGPAGRRLFMDGRQVAPAEYMGRLDAVVYSTERLRVVQGTMRDRRQFVDRCAAALWPSFRKLQRDFDRVLLQRNAALLSGDASLDSWRDPFADLAAGVRARRQRYVERLDQALQQGPPFAGERYTIEVRPTQSDESGHRVALEVELERVAREERRRGHSLVGPHRDPVLLSIDGEAVGAGSSAGQVRSLLLALTLAVQQIGLEERGAPPLALLDDLDSELDDERAGELCRRVALRGQALVTTAHPSWAERLSGEGQLFYVSGGRIRPA